MAPSTPERTCVGCRARSSKGDLVRIVASPTGPRVRSDGGRGAYVHRSGACIEAALARGTLARALRAGVGSEELARLGDAIRSLVEAR